MARGGINQALVKMARDTLQARGIHPSIDAVRVELGNTGSKTTIQRYLKILNEQTVSCPAPTFNDELLGLIFSLAERLKEEAQIAVKGERDALDQQRQAFNTQREYHQERIAELQIANTQLESQRKAEHQHEQDLQTQLRNSESERHGLLASMAGLEQLLAERITQVQLLEDQHRQARQSLEHYRQQQLEQRNQELQRHDAERQQMQHLVRTLQEQLLSKQSEAASLNRDNERLIGEARTIAQQHRYNMEHQQQELHRSHREDREAQLKELHALQESLAAAQAGNSILVDRLRQALIETRQARRQLRHQYQHAQQLQALLTNLTKTQQVAAGKHL